MCRRDWRSSAHLQDRKPPSRSEADHGNLVGSLSGEFAVSSYPAAGIETLALCLMPQISCSGSLVELIVLRFLVSLRMSRGMAYMLLLSPQIRLMGMFRGG